MSGAPKAHRFWSFPVLIVLLLAATTLARRASAQQTPTEVVQAALVALEEERYEDAVAFIDSATIVQYREGFVLPQIQGWPFARQEVRIDPELPQCVQDYLRENAETGQPFSPPPGVREMMLLGMPDEESLRALGPRELLIQAVRFRAQREVSAPSPNGIASRTARLVLGEIIEGERAFVLVEQIRYDGGYATRGQNHVYPVSLALRHGRWHVTDPLFLLNSGGGITSFGWFGGD